jgi:predicted O-linked N-acetylglucosamine transferase (SPINDLY family)
MGAEYIDYIIADSTIIPHGQERFYDEKIIRLPHCYQPHDSKRAASQNIAHRAEHGLPENAFVFCSFNNSYKITPDIFDIWMDILRNKENSVLWLLETTETACKNLSREAQKRGIEPSRLVFAPYVKQPDHLARYRFADLFLDTAPCSAHTTASDALWAGIPVLSCPTDTFAGRLAASILRTAGAQELVVETMADYKELALNLAHDPDRLDAIKQKLTQSRKKSSLYDTKSYTQNLEKAFFDMVLQSRARD